MLVRYELINRTGIHYTFATPMRLARLGVPVLEEERLFLLPASLLFLLRPKISLASCSCFLLFRSKHPNQNHHHALKKDLLTGLNDVVETDGITLLSHVS
jgi:hypothetical protein